MAPLSLKVVLDAGAVVTRTVKVDSKDSVEALLDVVKEKFMIADDGKEYGLFLTAADDDLSGVWLDSDRHAEYYMLRDGDELLLLCRTRNLRLRMLDGSVKTLQVDESQPISRILAGICARIGITNHEEYGLCYDEEDSSEPEPKGSTGTLTLKRAPQPRDRDAKLELMSKKLNTDDNVQWLDMHRTLREMRVGPRATLLLQRRLYYSDRNVDARDPVQLNLLYVQIRDDILDGRHPVTHEQAADCKLRWINIRDVNRRILRKKLSSPDNRGRLYKYETELSFMRPYYRDVNIQGADFEPESDDKSEHNWNDDDNGPDEAEEQIEPEQIEKPPKKGVKTPKKSSKRKKRQTYQEEEDEEDNLPIAACVNETTTVNGEGFDPTDPVDAFLISIGATLKTFTPYHLNLAKSKIFSVVQEHDLQQIVQKSSDVSVKQPQPETLYLS